MIDQPDPFPACPFPALPPPVNVVLTVCNPKPCPYLPQRMETLRAVYVKARCHPDTYHDFMQAGFRRSGRVLYQPVCRGCRQCTPVRVPVDRFQPSKSQRRCARRNADLRVEIGPPVLSDDKIQLYHRYQTERHGKPKIASEKTSDVSDTTDGPADATVAEELRTFLYDSPVDTVEFSYFDRAERLLGVGIGDVSARSLSSVYFYYDPTAAHRSLGVFSALAEIGFCREREIPHYHLGFWVHGCAKMRYKTDFQPCELLLPTGEWVDAEGLK